jgi:hypothetical protein
MLERNDSRGSATRLALTVAVTVGCLAAADLVLLDEYWVPEILRNETVATEIDVIATGDPDDARSGEVAAVLSNQAGAPNVRFRAAAMVTLGDIPLPASEARLWYRTDAWDGRWRLELWVHVHGLTPTPEKALEAVLDGGGEGGRLIADSQWHQAKGRLAGVEAYARIPQDRPVTTFVWLVPLDGWDKPHRTLIDRCETGLPGAPPDAAPAPARRIRPQPGAQTAGPGWLWWEAEDAVRHDFPPGGAYAAFTREQQEKLSHGDWLQWHGCTGHSASWTMAVAEAGSYSFWMRGSGPDGPFQLRWDHRDWRVVGPDDFDPLVDRRLIHDRGDWRLEVGWARLGQVDLSAGEHTFDLVGLPDAGGIAIDCWLLTRGAFSPDGIRKPTAQ